MTMHTHTDLESCTKGCPQYQPEQPDFDEFAHNPLGYAKTTKVHPTEEQERVAMELRGFYLALRSKGFDRDEAIGVLGSIFAAKAVGEEFTL